jgi:hypothetical protein
MTLRKTDGKHDRKLEKEIRNEEPNAGGNSGN